MPEKRAYGKIGSVLQGCGGTPWRTARSDQSFEATSVTIRPSKRQIVREAYDASCCEWVTMMIVVPSRLSSCRRFITSWPFFESRLPVGSSARISFGFETSAVSYTHLRAHET